MRFIFTVAAKSRQFARAMRSEYEWYNSIAQRLAESEFDCDSYIAVLVRFTDTLAEGGIEQFPNRDQYLQFDLGVPSPTDSEFHQRLLSALSTAFTQFFPNDSERIPLSAVLDEATNELRREEA